VCLGRLLEPYEQVATGLEPAAAGTAIRASWCRR